MPDARILQMAEIFTDLNSTQLDLIYSICRERIYSGGAVVVQEFTPSTEIYIILEGEVEILVGMNDPSGPQRLATLSTGQSFGEIALVDQGLRSASVRCISETCRLLVIDRDDLMKLLKKNLDIGFTVMVNLASDLCMKIRNTQYRAREQFLYSPSRPT